MPAQERAAIVTGASGAIGRAVAERLAQDGQAVVVGQAGNPDRALETVATVRAAGGTATACRAGVADAGQVAALFDHAEAEHGGVDVVVNAAGIMLQAAGRAGVRRLRPDGPHHRPRHVRRLSTRGSP